MSLKNRLERLEAAAGGNEERPLVVRIRWIDVDGNEMEFPDYSGGHVNTTMTVPPGGPDIRYIKVDRPPAERQPG